MNTEQLHLKPANPAVNVRKPNGEYLNPKGEKVDRSPYWVRRLRDGDVVDIHAAKSQAATAKAIADEKAAVEKRKQAILKPAKTKGE